MSKTIYRNKKTGTVYVSVEWSEYTDKFATVTTKAGARYIVKAEELGGRMSDEHRAILIELAFCALVSIFVLAAWSIG